MMKRIFTLIAGVMLIGALALSITACNKSKQSAKPGVEQEQEDAAYNDEAADDSTASEKNAAEKTEPKSFDYSKILKGDFFDFAGTWIITDENFGNGKIRIRSDGRYAREGERAGDTKPGDFTRNDNGSYSWKIGESEGKRWLGSVLFLYPVGVDIMKSDMMWSGNEIYPSDKTKVRITIWIMSGQDSWAEGPYYFDAPPARRADNGDNPRRERRNRDGEGGGRQRNRDRGE